jgi:hypothetical protein
MSMRKIIILDESLIPPFNEPARKLRVLNKPLWLYQQDVLARHCAQELEVESLDDIPVNPETEMLVYPGGIFIDGQGYRDSCPASAGWNPLPG